MKKNIKQEHRNKHKHIRYFKQYSIEEMITIPQQKPNIEDVVSVMVDPEIVSTRVINTPKGKSYEGQCLTGKKIFIEIKLKQKIVYISDEPTQSVHAIHNETYHSTFIVIPNLREKYLPEVLLKSKIINPKIIMEDIQGKRLDERHIFKNGTIFIEVCLPPSYCFCEGPTGPIGPIGLTGPMGPTGLTGPTGDCCCQKGLYEALKWLKDNQMTYNIKVQVYYFNQKIPITNSTIQGVYKDVVKIGGEYISICKIQYINYTFIGTLPDQSCNDKPYCCCNKGIIEILENATVTNIGQNNKFLINITGNLKIKKACPEVVWVQDDVKKEGYVISLCSILSVISTSTPTE